MTIHITLKSYDEFTDVFTAEVTPDDMIGRPMIPYTMPFPATLVPYVCPQVLDAENTDPWDSLNKPFTLELAWEKKTPA